jgi:pimeloyl-ACP methyl ester carboxylesterase
VPCPETPFTCVTLDVPIDHLEGTDGATIQVQFAVLPAEASHGAFVTVVGGPGGSGIDESVWMMDQIPPEIRDRFDLVFFDQRGVGLFEDPVCPEADETGAVALGDRPDWETQVDVARQYVTDCVEEMGNPGVLGYLGTEQAIHDLESFRQTMGYDRLSLWGQSYGTSFAQAYATEFPDHVERLVLDGTIDRTRDWIQTVGDDAEGQEQTLDFVFTACNQDPTCSGDMGMPAAKVYQRLLGQLEVEPAVVEYPVADDLTEERLLTAGDLSALAYGNVYSEVDRVLFLRALAAAAQRHDLLPLYRLAEADSGSVSSVLNLTVNCMDLALPGESPAEEIANLRRARAAAAVSDRWLYEIPLRCVFWPHVDHQRGPTPPFESPKIPTLVIAATADPATPYRHGVAVSEQAEQGHLLRVDGGSHVMFGRGHQCVDSAVIAFVIDGTGPDSQSCPVPIISNYEPILPSRSNQVRLEDLMAAIDDAINWFPSRLVWDGLEDLEVLCDHGGSVELRDNGYSIDISIDHCGFTDGIEVYGKAEWGYERGVTYLDVLSLSGTDCSYRYREDWETGKAEVDQRCR